MNKTTEKQGNRTAFIRQSGKKKRQLYKGCPEVKSGKFGRCKKRVQNQCKTKACISYHGRYTASFITGRGVRGRGKV